MRFRSRSRSTRVLCATLLLAGSACRSAPPPVDELLRAEGAGAGQETPSTESVEVTPRTLVEIAARIQSSVDERARGERAAAAAAPADAELAIAASRSLFLCAELRLRRAELGWIFEHPRASLEALLVAEDAIDTAVKDEMLAFSREGRELAQAALRAEPGMRAGLHYLALHSGQIAWAQGPARSLLGGWGPRVSDAIAAAVAAGEDFEAGAPLRLAGRFLTRAPWPYRDLAGGLRTLERAAEFGPVPITWLFVGDARWSLADRAGALEAWRRACTAQPDPASRDAAPLHRALARLRLERAASQGDESPIQE